MANFTTRVELHQAEETDYNTLHDAMNAEGFTRTISSSDGTYHLPTAEYNYNGSLTKSEVLDAAERASASTGKKHGILVTESNGRTWIGLEKI